jgi:hypothetical protein
MEAVLDIRIREPGVVEEVCSRDANRVAGPLEEVLAAGWYVEGLVDNLLEEGGYLGGLDLPAQACVWVVVNRGCVVVWHAKSSCPPNDV